MGARLISVGFKKLTATARQPTYADSGASGMDIYADAQTSLEPGQYGLISTGLALELLTNTEVQIRPRSGLAAKYGVTVLNAPGTVDASYRGEVKVVLINHGKEVFHVKPGDRIAQMVVAEVAQATAFEVDELSTTTRGSGGFGSTGA